MILFVIIFPGFRCSWVPVSDVPVSDVLFSVFLFSSVCFQMFLFSSVPIFHCFCFQMFLFSITPVFHFSHFQCTCYSVRVFRCSCFPVFLFLCSCCQNTQACMWAGMNTKMCIRGFKFSPPRAIQITLVWRANVDFGFLYLPIYLWQNSALVN